MSERSEFINGTIRLDEPNNVFYSGQVLSGSINFELNKPLPILAINVAYLGEATVSWTEEQEEKYLGVKRIKQVKYLGREEYFNFGQCLCGGIGVIVLPTGPHTIPFSYQIPHNAPSSFEGAIGNVSYKVSAIAIHKDGVTKNEIVKKFNVVAPLDLNKGSEDIKKPIVMEFDEVYSCNFFCSSKPLAMTIRCPSTGYCPGQVIPITIEARNESNVEVTKIVFQLTTKERYRSQQPPSERIPPEEVLETLKKGPILSKTTREYTCGLKVPDFIAPNMENCGIIDIAFFLKAKIQFSGCNDDMYEEEEICLGLVPLGSAPDVRATHPMAERLPIAPIPDQSPVPPIPNQMPTAPISTTQNPVAPPPSYEAAMFAPNLEHVRTHPGPIPYPSVANVVDNNMYNSKSGLVGNYDIRFRAPNMASPPPYVFPTPQNQPYPNQSAPYPTAPSAPPC